MPTLIKNKKANFDYEILEKFDAGIVLRGFEVKSLKNKQGDLLGSHVIVRGGEAFVVGMKIPPYQPKNAPEDYVSDQTRKLLLNKKEIAHLAAKESQKGLTLVPICVYTKGNLLKLSIGVARGQKKHDKREKIKKRESQREIERKMKESAR